MSEAAGGTTEVARWRARAERERQARLAAEAQAEQGLRQLYERQRELQVLHVTAAAANAAVSTEEALKVALDEFCGYTGWPVGHVFVAVPDRSGAVTPTEIWHLDRPETFRAFQEATQSMCFPPGGGLPGRVMAGRRPIWIEEVADDRNFPRGDSARAAGLRSAIAVPVLMNTEVAAVLEFYTQERCSADPGWLELAARMGTLLGRLFERQQAQEALRRAGAELEERVHRRTEELATANERLAKASRLKDEFLAAMSHELRTPLNTILGVTETLQEGVFGALNEKQVQSLQMIGESSHHLLALINDILDVSKIEAGKLVLDIETVPVQPICEAALRLVKPVALKKQLAMEFNVEVGLGPIPADQRRLKQMLVNLLSNAVKFTPDHGRIGLDLRQDPNRPELRLTVWDTGIGISAEDQSRLFQPFQQLDSRLSRNYNGSGLGLTLVSRMAALHGGRVSLESAPGQGSRFTIILPAPRPDASPIPAEAERSLPCHPTRSIGEPGSRPAGAPVVLITDDHAGNRGVLAAYLIQKGFCVLEASDGPEAIALALRHRPNLILMDGQMPGMDGFETTRQIKLRPECADIPVVALTAMAMAGDRERFLAAGYCDYLSKPASFAAIADAVRKHLRPDSAGSARDSAASPRISTEEKGPWKTPQSF